MPQSRAECQIEVLLHFGPEVANVECQGVVGVGLLVALRCVRPLNNASEQQPAPCAHSRSCSQCRVCNNMIHLIFDVEELNDGNDYMSSICRLHSLSNCQLYMRHAQAHVTVKLELPIIMISEKRAMKSFDARGGPLRPT